MASLLQKLKSLLSQKIAKINSFILIKAVAVGLSWKKGAQFKQRLNVVPVLAFEL